MQYIIAYSTENPDKLGSDTMQHIVTCSTENSDKLISDYFVEDDYKKAEKEYKKLLNKSDTHSASMCVVLKSSDYEEYEPIHEIKRDQQIQDLSEALLEKRSDISEILDSLLRTGEMNLDWIEHRFAKGKIKIKDAYIDDDGCLEVMYDTLTTHLEYPTKDGPWDIVSNEEYED